MSDDDKGWMMLAGSPDQGTAEAPPRVNLNWQRKSQGAERVDPDAMIDRYITARTPQGTRPMHAALRAENEHLRLSLATMGARERETAAERDALRVMLAEARDANDHRRSLVTDAGLAEIEALALAATPDVTDDGYRLRAPSGEVIVEYKHSLYNNVANDAALFTRARPIVLSLLAIIRARTAECVSTTQEGRISRLTAQTLRVAARRDQLTSDLSVVTGQCDAALAIIEGRTVAPTRGELSAHYAARGGRWLYDYRGKLLGVCWDQVALAAEVEGCRSGQIAPCRWWPLDDNGRPCAWPTTGGT